VTLTQKAEEMLRADLDNENQTVRAYRERVRQCEALGE
jgi:bacterioferritin